MDFDVLFGSESDWEGAKCLNRPDEFCPDEDIMSTTEWTKGIAPAVAEECLRCPVFEQCKDSLLEQFNDPDATPTGVMAGVVLVQKSKPQILKALGRVESKRSKIAEEEGSGEE